MKLKGIFIFIFVLIILAVGGATVASWLGAPKFEKKTQDAFARLEKDIAKGAGGTYSIAGASGLPQIVRQYLEKAMPASGEKISHLSLICQGRIKVTEDASWDDFQARQVISSRPPQLVWAGQTRYAPLMPLMIMSSYVAGRGLVESHLWGQVEMFKNQGELIKGYMMLRWLGESVWHPDCLLPDKGVRWEEVKAATGGTKQARVYLTDGGLTVSGVFIFPARGGAPMLFLSDGKPFVEFAVDRWYCSYSDWRRQGKFQVPFQLVQGTRHGIGDDRRLEITVNQISYR